MDTNKDDSCIIEIKVSDIDPVGRHPEDILSNLCKNTFCFDGVYCQCMEQFLQSLKYQDENIQIEICSSTFYDIEGDDTSDWRMDQILWWKGHPINRHSPEYHDFIYNAYMEMYLWSARFRNVLMSTEGKTLLYNSGNTNPYKTILTDEEFCKVLTDLREKNMEDYKKYIYPRRWPNCYGVEEDYI